MFILKLKFKIQILFKYFNVLNIHLFNSNSNIILSKYNYLKSFKLRGYLVGCNNQRKREWTDPILFVVVCLPLSIIPFPLFYFCVYPKVFHTHSPPSPRLFHFHSPLHYPSLSLSPLKF